MSVGALPVLEKLGNDPNVPQRKNGQIYFYSNYMAVKMNELELWILDEAHNIMLSDKGKSQKNTYIMISFQKNPNSWETEVCRYCKEKEKNRKNRFIVTLGERKEKKMIGEDTLGSSTELAMIF